MPMVKYEREKLYEEIWAEPMGKVAEWYGVSDVALGKICRRLHIPLPGRGYWAKVKAGKPTRKLALPESPDGAPPIWVTWQRNSPKAKPLSPETSLRVEQEKRAVIAIPEDLKDAHDLVAAASRLLVHRKPQGGLVFWRSRRCLDVKVAPDRLDRALRIMDALLKALEARDLQVEVTPLRKDDDANVTRVLVEGEWIPFGLTEELDTVRTLIPSRPRISLTGSSTTGSAITESRPTSCQADG